MLWGVIHFSLIPYTPLLRQEFSCTPSGPRFRNKASGFSVFGIVISTVLVGFNRLWLKGGLKDSYEDADSRFLRLTSHRSYQIGQGSGSKVQGCGKVIPTAIDRKEMIGYHDVRILQE